MDIAKPCCALYRHFDDADSLLYVGISVAALSRTNEHQRASAWFNKVARIEIQWFPDRESALQAEVKAILDERPKYNIQGVPAAARGNRSEPSKPSSAIYFQRFSLNGVEMVALPAKDFERLISGYEDRVDVEMGTAALIEMRKSGGMPGEVLKAVLAGIHPIKAWRKYRRMSQVELAAAAGFQQGAIWRLEAAKPGAGKVETREAIAKALGAPRWAIEGAD